MAIVFAMTLAAAAVGCGGSGPPGKLPLRKVADVPLPDGTSRFDYQSLDAARNRLFISHLGADDVIVFDVKNRRVIRTIPDLPGVHGVLVAPSLRRVYAATTDSHQLATIDERTGKVLNRVPAGEAPDGIAFDPVDREVFVSDESGDSLTVADALSGKRVAAIPLAGSAGNVQYDPVSHLLLVDTQARNQLAVVDPVARRVIARYPLPGCFHDHGLHLDPPRRLAFIACDGSATLLVFDLVSKTVTARYTVGSAPDVLAFDPGLRRLYVSAESGVVGVFAEEGRRLRKLGQGHLAKEAHTVSADPRSHLVYFPLADVNGRPVLRIMRPVLRVEAPEGN